MFWRKIFCACQDCFKLRCCIAGEVHQGEKGHFAYIKNLLIEKFTGKKKRKNRQESPHAEKMLQNKSQASSDLKKTELVINSFRCPLQVFCLYKNEMDLSLSFWTLNFLKT